MEIQDKNVDMVGVSVGVALALIVLLVVLLAFSYYKGKRFMLYLPILKLAIPAIIIESSKIWHRHSSSISFVELCLESTY